MNPTKTKTGLDIVTQQGDMMVISDQKVMKSAAGYYVGVGYTESIFVGGDENMVNVTEDMLGYPYSRDSDYFATAEDAQKYLDYINRDDQEQYAHPSYFNPIGA